MYIHRRPSKFALPPRFSTPLLCFSASFLFFLITPSSLSIFHLASAAPEFSPAAPVSLLRENFCTCTASCLASSLQRAFLRHPFPSGRIRRCRLSRSSLVERARTGNFDTPDGDKTRRALWKFFSRQRKFLLDYRPFNFRYLFGQPPPPSLSEFLRLHELCPRRGRTISPPPSLFP